LQSFVNYPGTPWGDPQRVLTDLRQRYSRTPLFIEATAAGPPSLKARWLTDLGDAVDETPGVYAVLYHEGGPALAPTKADGEFWSLASDRASLDALKGMFQEFDRERSRR
jgi:hypothetical protein